MALLLNSQPFESNVWVCFWQIKSRYWTSVSKVRQFLSCNVFSRLSLQTKINKASDRLRFLVMKMTVKLFEILQLYLHKWTAHQIFIVDARRAQIFYMENMDVIRSFTLSYIIHAHVCFNIIKNNSYETMNYWGANAVDISRISFTVRFK